MIQKVTSTCCPPAQTFGNGSSVASKMAKRGLSTISSRKAGGGGVPLSKKQLTAFMNELRATYVEKSRLPEGSDIRPFCGD